MARKRSVAWTRDRTHTIVARDKNGKVLHMVRRIAAHQSERMLGDLRKQHSSLTLTRYVDNYSECSECDATGLTPNERYLCAKCDGEGRVLLDEMGLEIT